MSLITDSEDCEDKALSWMMVRCSPDIDKILVYIWKTVWRLLPGWFNFISAWVEALTFYFDNRDSQKDGDIFTRSLLAKR